MLSAGFPQSAAAGRDALDTFMKDNLYKYDVIAMKDTDTGKRTYFVADRGPCILRGTEAGTGKKITPGGARGLAPGRTSGPLRKWKRLPAFQGMKVL